MDPKKDVTGAASNVVPGPQLESMLPAPAGYARHHTTSLYQHELKASEIQRTYLDEAGSSIFISIADLGHQPAMYKNFITGGGLRQSSVGNSFGLAFRQASLQGSADYGLLLGQQPPAYLGQASGVISMAQQQQPIQFSVVSQSSLPARQLSPQAEAQRAAAAQGIATSPQGAPAAAPCVPQATPFPPLTFTAQGPATSVVYVETTISAGQASAGATQISSMLQSSGVNLRQLAQLSQSSPFSLSETMGADGSYIRPFGLDTGHDVAGWEIYDARARIGALVLGMKDRLGILIEAGNLSGLDSLLEIAGKLDYAGLDKLMAHHK